MTDGCVDYTYIASIYRAGFSIPEISNMTGIHRSTVRYNLNKIGVLRSIKDSLKIASEKGKLGGGFRGKNRIFSDEHKKAISLSRLKHAEANAKGVSLKPSGYIEITRGENKGRPHHRVVMESHIGRKLETWEHVHHKDGNRTNNDISNLELMSASEHMSHHAKENYQSRRRNKNGTWS